MPNRHCDYYEVYDINHSVTEQLADTPTCGPDNSRMQFCWATICKTVHPMLSDRCLSCTACNVGVLWPNGLTDQDETWHAGRPRPWPHCVRWGPSSPSPKETQPPNFRPISVAAKWLHRSRCHLLWR